MNLGIALMILIFWVISLICTLVTMVVILQSIGAQTWLYVTYGAGVVSLLITLGLGKIQKAIE